ncbi:MAG: helix-turn-helix transcriptional regulator [Firmicutes bacterium]|nr:helix-turn-helix transcriptional regulator [Bacillota bacterium]
MNELSRHIGSRIRSFRKAQGLTLQQMADRLEKSKATMSKYETGDIILDVETLYAIANLLQIGINQLTDYRPEAGILPGGHGTSDGHCTPGGHCTPDGHCTPEGHCAPGGHCTPEGDAAISTRAKVRVSPDETSCADVASSQSPFFQADLLYFYYYDGRYRRLKSGIIRISRSDRTRLECAASIVISSATPMGRSDEEYYTGTVLYSDMVIRFSFVNQWNGMEQDMLYIFNPPCGWGPAGAAGTRETPGATHGAGANCAEGLLSGISTVDQMPCAFKCLVSLRPLDVDLTSGMMQRLTFTRRQLQRLQKLNMLLVDNQE